VVIRDAVSGFALRVAQRVIDKVEDRVCTSPDMSPVSADEQAVRLKTGSTGSLEEGFLERA